ncbi:MAG: glutamate 5-kinase, partial [Microvirga sp.]
MSASAEQGAERLRSARRVVVKVGSALLVDAATGRLNRDWLAALAEDLA